MLKNDKLVIIDKLFQEYILEISFLDVLSIKMDEKNRD